MPRQIDNVIMRNTQGTFADQVVFKIRKGKMVLARPTRVKPGRVATDKQVLVKEKFRNAVMYGKAAVKNAALKAQYEAAATGGQTAFNRACQDYHIAPSVISIDAENYKGEIGNILSLAAVDDFRVEKLNVSINDENGELIEQGSAIQSEEDARIWNYTTIVANPNLPGTKISATAFDVPKNTGTLEKTL